MPAQPMGNGERLLRTFIFFSLTDLGLMFCTIPIYLFEPGGYELGPGPYSMAWVCVFALPVVVALQQQGTGPHMILVVLMNPLIYGLIGTLAWRMWRSSRQPRAEG